MVQRFNLCFLQPKVTSKEMSRPVHDPQIFSLLSWGSQKKRKNYSHLLKSEINLNVDN